MKRQLHAALAVWISLAVAISGCAPTQPYFFMEDGDLSHYVGLATAIEHPDVETCSLAEVENAGQPYTVTDHNYSEVWELSLQDSVRIALENSKVMRQLGGRQASFGGQRPQQDEFPTNLLQAPLQVPTVYDPAIVEADPNFGVEAALSNFDAQLGSQLLWQKNERPVNQIINPAAEDLFARISRQSIGQWNSTLSKRSVTGGRFAVAANTTFTDSNSPLRESASDYLQNFEVQASHPLLQGAGIFFNRIAGPFDPFNGTGTPNFDGVVLARIRTDVSLADFEAGVRNLVNDVEGAYWNLYFAYRNLEARKVGRDSALQTWRKVKALFDANAKGGEADKEAQAREQYYFFRGEVETALSDLFRAESRLRYMMGLAATDGRLISTATEPSTARTTFDWNQIHSESLIRTVELRQQRWRIKQRELELMASKNLLLPRLDAIARYRWLGLGENWLDADGRGYTAQGTDSIVGTDAFSTLADGDFQESEVGLQFNMPIGFRRELATVREQQLLLARERSILQDQELEQSHALAEAIRVLDISYTLMQTNFNRAVAAQRQVEAVAAAYEVGTVTLDLLLDAQRRLADALSSGYRAQADYNRNIAQIHFRKGSLLEYNGVYLAEGPWPAKAYFDAHRRARARDAATYLDYGFTRPDVVSLGPVDEHGGDMIHGGAIPEGTIMHEGPLESIPVPATPSVIPAEEMPQPGPQVGPVSSRDRARAVTGRQVSSSASDYKGGRFDWQMDDTKPTATAKSVMASSKPSKTPAPATKDDDVAEDGPLLTPPASETPKNSKWRDTNVRAASAEIPVGSGWKRAQR